MDPKDTVIQVASRGEEKQRQTQIPVLAQALDH